MISLSGLVDCSKHSNQAITSSPLKILVQKTKTKNTTNTKHNNTRNQTIINNNQTCVEFLLLWTILAISKHFVIVFWIYQSGEFSFSLLLFRFLCFINLKFSLQNSSSWPRLVWLCCFWQQYFLSWTFSNCWRWVWRTTDHFRRQTLHPNSERRNLQLQEA